MRNENGAAGELVRMRLLEDRVDVVERMLFDERRKIDLAVEHEIERGRIEFRRASPVSQARASKAMRLDRRSSTRSIVKPTTHSVAP